MHATPTTGSVVNRSAVGSHADALHEEEAVCTLGERRSEL